jgi:NADH-quinone oxidoreductase subunit K
VNLLVLAYARMRGDATGQMVVFFVIAVAAAEAAVGLAIFVALFRARRTIDVDEIATLKW